MQSLRSVRRFYSKNIVLRDLGAVIKPLKPSETFAPNIPKQQIVVIHEEHKFDTEKPKVLGKKDPKEIVDATILW
jgi:hypothetical protein